MDTQTVEICEAEQAAKSVINQIDLINNELQRAKIWGFIDLFSDSGFLTTLGKHSHLHDAQKMLDDLYYKITILNDELDDIKIDGRLNDIMMSQGIEIADWLIDGLFIDAITLSKISKSQKQMDNLKKDICNVLDKLNLVKNVL